MSSADPVGQVERLLGAPLPPGRKVSYFRWQPSRALAYFTAYVKFGASREEFTDLVRRARMSRRGEGDALRYLPAAWAAEPELRLGWWDPGPGTPPDSAARGFGVNGWIVAKHERGTAYLIVTDTGHAEGTPGPT